MCGIEMLTGVTKGDVADRPWSVENSLRITHFWKSRLLHCIVPRII
jgi:hypothetical protein